MKRVDKTDYKPKRLNVTVTDDQYDFVHNLVKAGEFDSAADYVRYLIDWAMQPEQDNG